MILKMKCQHLQNIKLLIPNDSHCSYFFHVNYSLNLNSHLTLYYVYFAVLFVHTKIHTVLLLWSIELSLEI